MTSPLPKQYDEAEGSGEDSRGQSGDPSIEVLEVASELTHVSYLSKPHFAVFIGRLPYISRFSALFGSDGMVQFRSRGVCNPKTKSPRWYRVWRACLPRYVGTLVNITAALLFRYERRACKRATSNHCHGRGVAQF